jgi:hypothetical protein
VQAALRRLVCVRARYRCEYCLAPESLCFLSHQVDHIVAEKHGGLTEAENLALSCIACNQAKGSDLCSIDPKDGKLVPLFNPRTDLWPDHFEISGCLILPKTDIGRVTAKLLQFNAPQQVVEREAFLASGLYDNSPT